MRIEARLVTGISILGLAACSSGPVRLNADPGAPIGQLAIIRAANKAEQQQAIHLFKPNYTEHLASIRDAEGNSYARAWDGFTDKEAHVAPGRYVATVLCVIAGSGMDITLTFEEPIVADAGMIYALECTNVAAPRTHVVVEARRQGTAPPGKQKVARKRS